MISRKLGNQGLAVPAIGLGCMGMSIAYGVRVEADAIATIDRAIDLDVAFLDTSDAYGSGKNEDLVGKAIAGKRNKVILASKFGNIRLPEGTVINGKPDYVIRACEASLKRLGTDVIDLYYQHRVDPQTPIEDTVGAMSRLVEQGKVRFLGLSEAGAQTIRRAHATYPISALQTEYSLWTRDVEAEILPACRELGIGFVPYSPLGRGFLSATIRTPDDLVENDRRHDHPRFWPENMEKNGALLGVLEEVATRHSATAAQVALAWLLAQGEDIVPIPGTKKTRFLDENLAAIDLALSDADRQDLTSVFQPGITAGTRYPEKQLPRLGI
ncbi:MAG: aldo/keto reductase [Alphaproteobacteria bacterium]|nr:MAG: aldo/keto reductase [Alphaproteobacteria bacterium]